MKHEHSLEFWLWRFRLGVGWHDQQWGIGVHLNIFGVNIPATSLRVELVNLFLQADFYYGEEGE